MLAQAATAGIGDVQASAGLAFIPVAFAASGSAAWSWYQSSGPSQTLADAVEQAIAVAGNTPYRRGAARSRLAGVLVGEFTLPGVGQLRPPGVELRAPSELGRSSTTGSPLPLRLAGG